MGKNERQVVRSLVEEKKEVCCLFM